MVVRINSNKKLCKLPPPLKSKFLVFTGNPKASCYPQNRGIILYWTPDGFIINMVCLSCRGK
jgi:hypothetical protein